MREENERGKVKMVFSSTVFLFLFLPLVLIGYYNPIFKSRKFKNIFLLLVSLLFYAWGEPVFVFIMIASIIINWFIALKIDKYSDDKKKKKKYATLAIIYNVGLLFIFKYLSFVVNNIGMLIKNDNLTLNIALPIGISFFTFQMLSYVLDIYFKKAKVQKNVLYVGLYVSLFPQLIAGPIVRYETVANEIEKRKETFKDFCDGLYRFVYGLGKKVLISNYVGLIVDNIFVNMTGGNLSVLTAWIGAIAYTLQIYFDFSGYSDMAIGLGKMFGFHFNENFNYPYIAKSITDFWRRWHISLSTWFRDYVYIPLGGNRVSAKRHIFNLFVVWLLTGIWHGANWTFIIWGLFYFVLLMIEKKTKIIEKLGIFSYIYTLFFVIIGWVIFRANDLGILGKYLGYMFNIGSNGLVDSMSIEYIKTAGIAIIIGIIGSLPISKFLKEHIKIKNDIKEIIEMFFVILIFTMSILVSIRATYNPFIYFNF